MKLLYFAWIKEKAGVSQEDVSPPESVATVADLIQWQVGRGGRHAEAFADEAMVRVAVTQENVSFDTLVALGHDTALLPPGTGG